MNELQEAYARFADKDINVLAISQPHGSPYIYMHVEYMLRRQRDGKIIWPHIVIADDSLLNALKYTEETVDLIRGN